MVPAAMAFCQVQSCDTNPKHKKRQLRDDFEKHTCNEDASQRAEVGEPSSNRLMSEIGDFAPTIFNPYVPR